MKQIIKNKINYQVKTAPHSLSIKDKDYLSNKVVDVIIEKDITFLKLDKALHNELSGLKVLMTTKTDDTLLDHLQKNKSLATKINRKYIFALIVMITFLGLSVFSKDVIYSNLFICISVIVGAITFYQLKAVKSNHYH